MHRIAAAFSAHSVNRTNLSLGSLKLSIHVDSVYNLMNVVIAHASAVKSNSVIVSVKFKTS